MNYILRIEKIIKESHETACFIGEKTKQQQQKTLNAKLAFSS